MRLLIAVQDRPGALQEELAAPHCPRGGELGELAGVGGRLPTLYTASLHFRACGSISCPNA